MRATCQKKRGKKTFLRFIYYYTMHQGAGLAWYTHDTLRVEYLVTCKASARPDSSAAAAADDRLLVHYWPNGGVCWSHVFLHDRRAGIGWRTAWKSWRSSPARSGSWKVGVVTAESARARCLLACLFLSPVLFLNFLLDLSVCYTCVLGIAGARFTLIFTPLRPLYERE
jgi:hypothetical protein